MLPNYLIDPHIHYPIDNYNLPFENYITASKNIIQQCLPNQADNITAANSPFELLPMQPILSTKNPNKLKYGALLIHGLLDTPFMMRDIGNTLQTQGLLVRSIVLPGHGTVPGALLNVKLEDWLQSVRYGIAALKKIVDKIFLVGFSTGATLSLYQSLQDPDAIAGIIMLAPAFKIRSNFDFLAQWTNKVSAYWLTVQKELNFAKYSSIPFNAVHQVYRLTQLLKNQPQPSCPIFMACSYDDRIVYSPVAIDYFRHYTNPKNKMILYTTKTHENFHDSRITVRNSAYPQWNIINFSHISIPIAPTNPHYGIKGDYILASHVEDTQGVVYGALDRPLELWYESLYKLKLTGLRYERLTFNPDFDFMVKEMSQFILNIS